MLLTMEAQAEDAANPPGVPPDPYRIPRESSLDPRKIWLQNLLIEPGGHLSFRDDSIRTHLRGLVGVGHDSNPAFDPAGSPSDAFAVAHVGTDVGIFIGENDKVIGVFDLGVRRYQEQNEYDQLLYRAVVNHLHEGQVLGISSTLTLDRTDYPYYRYDPPIDRQRLVAQTRLGFTGSRDFIGISASAFIDDWREATQFYDEDEYDSFGGEIEARYERQFSELTAATAGLSFSTRRYAESSSRFQENIGTQVQAGARIATGTRSWATVEGGVIAKVYEDDFAGDPAYDDQTVIAPLVRLGWWWTWNHGNACGATTYAAINDHIGPNAVINHGLRLDYGQRIGWRHYLGAVIHCDRFQMSGAAAGAERETRYQISAIPTWDIRLLPGIGVRLEQQIQFADDAANSPWSRYTALIQFSAVF